MYLIDGTGALAAGYSYDPYGQIQQSSGPMAQINPLRYRGYYYDSDTEFYYLHSRYYDAATCRFINADSYSSTGQGIIGYNMFAYCGNEPINRSDETGDFWNILAGAAIGGVISAASQFVTNVVTRNDWSDGVLEAGVAGAISGGLAATGLGRRAQAIGNAIIGCVSEGINQYKNYKKDPNSFSLSNAIISVGAATACGAVSGWIGGDGARAKGTDYKGALENAKSVANKVAGTKYSNPRTPQKLLYHANKAVYATGRDCTRKTSVRFYLGAKFSQYCMAFLRENLPN